VADATGERRKAVLVGGAARPGAGRDIGDRMKLHRHLVRLDGRHYTVITPRPGTGPRFSTNRYHETWHVLSGLRGSQLLAHLLWGLAYQRVPGTLVVIGAPWPGQRQWHPPPDARHRISRTRGMLTLTATAPELKSWAVAVARLGDWLQDGMDYTDLNGTDGEVQVFTDYTRRVSAARTARCDILAGPAGTLSLAD
jgi:hypothetical protein